MILREFDGVLCGHMCPPVALLERADSTVVPLDGLVVWCSVVESYEHARRWPESLGCAVTVLSPVSHAVFSAAICAHLVL